MLSTFIGRNKQVTQEIVVHIRPDSLALWLCDDSKTRDKTQTLIVTKLNSKCDKTQKTNSDSLKTRFVSTQKTVTKLKKNLIVTTQQLVLGQ